MKLQIDIPQRYAKQRAHTATHILHSELSTIFPQTKQAGSLVDEDMVRFDFYADRLLDDEEISSLEEHINKVIYQGHDVVIQDMKKTDAENLGAKMFFEDKYGEVVRVVQIADYKSIELCGGTHVTNTKEIGSCVII
jgi:alanyl-tRNA synthetase